jgi:hypothetical protein
MKIQEKEHNIQNIFGIIFMAFNVLKDVCYAKNKVNSNHKIVVQTKLDNYYNV